MTDDNAKRMNDLTMKMASSLQDEAIKEDLAIVLIVSDQPGCLSIAGNLSDVETTILLLDALRRGLERTDPMAIVTARLRLASRTGEKPS